METDYYIYILVIAAVAVAFVLWIFGVKVLNAVPASWLCDYGEEPSKELLNIRFSVKKTVAIGISFAICCGISTYIYGFSWACFLFILSFFLILLIGLCDAKYTIIPDQFTAMLLVVAIAFAVVDLFTTNIFITTWWSPILGGVCGGGLLLIINFLSLLLFKKEGIGFGDVKLFAALGVLFGFPWVFATATISIFVAFFHFVFLLLFKKAKGGNYLPLGPYICIGTVLTILFNNYILQGVNWYLSILGI